MAGCAGCANYFFVWQQVLSRTGRLLLLPAYMSPSASLSLPQTLLAAWQREVHLTHPFLTRLPAEHFDWQPHASSRTLGQLASHLADLPARVERTLVTDSYDAATLPAVTEPAPATSPAEVLTRFTTHAASVSAALAAASEAALTQVWTLRHGERVLFSQPRVQLVRALLLDHLIHHRGQLSVYLRLLGVAVPGTYGPTADEPAPATAQ